MLLAWEGMKDDFSFQEDQATAEVTLMKGEPTVNSGMWKETKAENIPPFPPYVFNHHLSGQSLRKNAMKSNAENVNPCLLEGGRETFHGWTIVVFALVSSLVSVPFSMKGICKAWTLPEQQGWYTLFFPKQMRACIPWQISAQAKLLWIWHHCLISSFI